MTAVELGRVGIWSLELRFADPAFGVEAAVEIEELGYGALWIPGAIDGGVLADVDRLMSATKRLAIATGIINIWKQQPEDVADWWRGQPADRQARVMLGLGVSHAPIIGESWGKPLALMRDYLDRLDASGLPPSASCIAALGPKMLELAGRRTAGSHPYLVTPEQSSIAREIMGPGKLIAPEQGVVLEEDPAKARELGRAGLRPYLALPNYKNNWKRLGYSDDEIERLDDRLVDGIIAWGSPARIAERIKAHHDAGADHVCLQVMSGGDFERSRAAYRELAAAVL